jgi:hypothetical protein
MPTNLIHARAAEDTFARIAPLKPGAAGVTNVTAATQRTPLTGDTIREFLGANSVDAAGGSTDKRLSRRITA